MFKVGDKVTGKPGNGYVITTERATLVVVSVNKRVMKIKLLSHKSEAYTKMVGDVFSVFQNKFTKIVAFKGNK